MTDQASWETRRNEAAWAFACQCSELKKSNPYDLVALDGVINTLMTELWDMGFSQSEIRSAFEQALSDMPRYAGGLEKRRD